MSLKYQTKPNSGFGICATNLSACQPKDNQLLITPRCRDVSVHQFLWGDNYTNHWQSTKGLFLPAQCWGREGKEETNSSKVTKVKKISLNLLQHTMLEYRIALILLVVLFSLSYCHHAIFFQLPGAAQRHVRSSWILESGWKRRKRGQQCCYGCISFWESA